jgi:hypothetical protein
LYTISTYITTCILAPGIISHKMAGRAGEDHVLDVISDKIRNLHAFVAYNPLAAVALEKGPAVATTGAPLGEKVSHRVE